MISNEIRSSVCKCLQPKRNLREDLEQVQICLHGVLRLLEGVLVQCLGVSMDILAPSSQIYKRQKIDHQNEAVSKQKQDLMELAERLNNIVGKFSHLFLEYSHSHTMLIDIRTLLLYAYFLQQENNAYLPPNTINYTTRLSSIPISTSRTKEYTRVQTLLSRYLNCLQTISRGSSRKMRDNLSEIESIIQESSISVIIPNSDQRELTHSPDMLYSLKCQALYLLGCVFYCNKNYEEASSRFIKCIQEQFRLVDAISMASVSLFMQNKKGEALQLFEKHSSVIDPSCRQVLYNMATIYHQQNQPNFELKTLLFMNQSKTAEKRHNGTTLPLFNSNSSPQVTESLMYYLTAMAAFDCADYPNAYRYFSMLFSKKQGLMLPNHIDREELFHKYIFVLLECKLFQKCIEICDDVLQANHKDLTALMYKADALFESYQTPVAIDCLSTAISHFPLNTAIPSEIELHIVNNFCVLLSCAGNYETAIEHLKQLVSKWPGSCVVHFNYAVVALKLHKETECCTTWLPFMSIPLDKEIDFYQQSLEEYKNKELSIGDDSNEPSIQQVTLLTRLCLEHWISRSTKQFNTTASLLSKYKLN